MPNTHSAAVRPQATRLRSRSKSRKSARRIHSAVTAGLQASPASVEALEARQLLSVSHDAAGFTVVTPGAGDRVVYVSSGKGNDANSGLSESAPVRSIKRGISLLRNNTGDQLLLRGGDVWHETFNHWKLSGKSASQPMVIGAYGGGSRPRLETGNNTALTAWASTVHDLDILGVELSAAGRGGALPDGISVSGRMSRLLVEDCKITGYRNNITLQNFFGPITGFTLRRSVVADSYSPSSHSQGIYAEGVGGITLEENVFDHNGWGHGAGQTMFNHDAYITASSSGLVARGNVFANASSHGLQARPGGIVENNLFVNDATGLTFGLVNGGGSTTAGGVSGRVTGNVFLGGHNINGLAAGVGMEISNTKRGANVTVSDNVFAFGPSSDNAAINLAVGNSTVNGGAAVGINDLTLSNNIIYKWSRGLNISGSLKPGGSGPTGLNNLTVRNNDFQAITSFQAVMHFAAFSTATEHWSGNRYDVPGNSKTPLTIGSRGLSVAGWKAYESTSQNTRVNYPAPRNLDSYAPDFLAKARSLSKGSWNPKYLAASAVSYIKAGFRGGSVVTPPSIPVITVPKPSTGGAGTPGVSVGDISSAEGNSGTKPFTFTIRLDKTSAQKVSVNWETKGLTGLVDKDYIGQHGTAAFSPGETSKTVTIAVKADKTKEATEQFVLNLLSASGGTITDSQAVATIVNDD